MEQFDIDLYALEHMETRLSKTSMEVDSAKVPDPFKSVSESLLQFISHCEELKD